MARWTIGAVGHQLVIATTKDGRVRLSIGSSEPIVADVEQVESIRSMLGAAIAAARGDTPGDPA